MRVCLPILIIIASALSLQGQATNLPEANTGSIVGTVTTVNRDALAGAKVVLEGTGDRRTTVSDDNGFFEFHNIQPRIPYHISINAEGFEQWTSPAVIIGPEQYSILPEIQLRVASVNTAVNVAENPEEAATEEVKIEEKQRVFGVIPNFYVVYDHNPAPLTTKLKFKLAARVLIDPMTFAGLAILSGAQQAGDTPDFGQGAQGFAKRFGANTTDGVTDIMIGGAILPSLLHQDPRYFYQGTGTVKSRMRHAALSPFICKGDNGKMQPNFSSLGGDLASSAISNAYYPDSNRGVSLTFTNFAVGTAERVAEAMVQEFVLPKLTHRPGNSR
jgi:Carboxypeptidase regulatory-like domain